MAWSLRRLTGVRLASAAIPRMVLGMALIGAVVQAAGPGGAAAQDAAAGSPPSAGADRAAGRIVVKLRAGLAEDVAAQVLASAGVTPGPQVGRTGARVGRVAAGQEQAAIDRLRQRAEVEYAEPDYVVHAMGSLVPSDPLYGSQWDLPKIDMPDAWGVSLGSGVLVAVIDTGILMTHEDLVGQWTYAVGHAPAEHVFLTPPVSNGCAIPTTPADDDGHGTHVSGTIVANSTLVGGAAVGIAGMAPAARVMPLKALDCQGTGFLSDVADAMDFATDNGASVISMSLGGVLASCPAYLAAAANHASAAGVFVAAAAGNDGNTSTEYPAGCAGVVGVAATDSNDGHASFSNRNSSVALAAPGVNTISTWITGGYTTLSGTSMSTPHVAGCAALVKAAGGGSGPQILSTLKSTAVDLGTAGYDTSFGYGRIDCGQAVQVAAGAPLPTATPTRTPLSTSLPGSPTAVASPTRTGTPGVGLPDLTVLASGPRNPVNLNTTFSYTIQISNAGSGNASSVVLAVSPPVGVTFAGAIMAPGFQCVIVGGTLECSGPSLAPQANASITPFFVADDCQSPKIVTAVVDPDNIIPESNEANNSATASATIVCTATPTSTPSLTPTSTQTAGSNISCGSFATWQEAQDFFISAGGPLQDPFGLDGDHDGIACESLPGAPGNAATATIRALTPSATRSPVATATLTPTPTRTAGSVSPTGTPTPIAIATSTTAPTATATRLPSLTPTLTKTPSPSLTQTPNAISCASFGTWQEAQNFFLEAGGPLQDPFGLDGDHDGIACESLPGAPANPATATAKVFTATPTPSQTAGVAPSATPTAGIGSPTATATPTATVPAGVNRFEDNSSAISYSSSAAWAQVLDASASAGHYRRASQTGASATFSLTTDGGARVTWGAVLGPTGGNADVALDGVFLATVSLYAPATLYGPVGTYAVPDGHHTLRVTVRGDHDPSSSGFDVTVDFFDQLPAIGGRGFTLQRAGDGPVGSTIQATWAAGAAQSGYLIGRFSASGLTVLPQNGVPLSSTATSFTDVAVLTDPLYCYLLVPVQGTPATGLGNSDELCTLTGLRSGSVPSGFSVRLNESNTATLSWSPPPVDLGGDYVVLALNGNGLRTITVPHGTFTLADDTGGQPTCYAVVTSFNGSPYGNTDGLCGVPGQAHL